MKIKQTTKYAFEVIEYLEKQKKYTTAEVIAEDLHISPTYLLKVLHRLKHDNLIRAVRGTNGGYASRKDSYRITYAQVLRAMSDGTDVHMKNAECSEKFFDELQKMIDQKTAQPIFKEHPEQQQKI